MRFRTETLEGKKHVIVPVVMAIEGILNGSKGPLYYPASELRASVPHWNGRPIVIYHPSMEHSCMAGSPEVFSRQKVGVVFRARFEGKALKADAWLDPDRLAAVDRRILAAINRGEMVEISTGLFTDNDPEPGQFNGRKYTAIARNYRPDHLALLPDMKGACSIADGAGLCRNEVAEEEPLLAPAMA